MGLLTALNGVTTLLWWGRVCAFMTILELWQVESCTSHKATHVNQVEG